jgi:thiol-disulfide isomerase/thioredoxin
MILATQKILEIGRKFFLRLEISFTNEFLNVLFSSSMRFHQTIVFVFFLLMGCSANYRAPLPPLSSKTSVEHLFQDLQPKPTLIHFWAGWCKSCVHELPSFQEFSKFANANGVQTIGIIFDEEQSVPAHIIREKDIRFPNFLDPSSAIRNHFDITGVPTTILVKPSGSLVFFRDPESRIRLDRLEGSQPWHSRVMQDMLLESLKQ